MTRNAVAGFLAGAAVAASHSGMQSLAYPAAILAIVILFSDH